MQNLILTFLMALPVVMSPSPPAAPGPAIVPTAKHAGQVTAVGQYLIRIRFLEKRADGEEKRIAEPVLVTCEGRPAKLQVGGEVPAPAHCGVDTVPFGVSCDCTIRGSDQRQLFLDITLVTDRIASSDHDSVVAVGNRVRVVEKITLGKRRAVALKQTEHGSYRLEWVVERVAP
jgi:hypothetical protein